MADAVGMDAPSGRRCVSCARSKLFRPDCAKSQEFQDHVMSLNHGWLTMQNASQPLLTSRASVEQSMVQTRKTAWFDNPRVELLFIS
ncbi:hypothetical protein CBOM_07881 [Ceraceosorus bombacis]|uniref:Uncharacterized protein n=1 Tax=Ceraceosorus bombacis TaxID=401625 RepID=A0A0P1B9E5_9BASI|nr:hypothetical protein CBOM_07881 [Ceraceosorus bombacis]